MNEAPRDGEKTRRFIDLIRRASVPILPEPPSALPPDYRSRRFPDAIFPLSGIKAVLFDVYGTLFVSSSGETATADEYRRGSADAVAGEFAPSMTGEELKAYFRSAVQAEHERLFAVTPFPEVAVGEIWSRLPGLAVGADPEELALRFELALNPCYPMPALAETLMSLKTAALTIGLVTNAQAFTPLYFKAILDKDLEEFGFLTDLCVFSYRYRRAKPCPALFATAASALAAVDINPAETLFVGNDMLNDIYGANAAGFRTCLFAGDSRSLRLRLGNPLCSPSRCDVVIQALTDLPALCGIGART